MAARSQPDCARPRAGSRLAENTASLQQTPAGPGQLAGRGHRYARARHEHTAIRSLRTNRESASGFNGKSWLDQVGHPSSEALRVTERFRRRDFGHMEMQATIDDAMAYTKPWSFTQQLTLMADTDLLELVCNENNKDLPHLKGK